MISLLNKKFLDYKDKKVHVKKALRRYMFALLCFFEDDLNCGNTNLNEDMIVEGVIAI